MVFPPSYTACQNCVFKFRIIPLPYSNKVCFSHIILKKMLLFPFLSRRNTCYNALRIWVFLFATIHVRVSTQQRTRIVLYFYGCIYIIYYTIQYTCTLNILVVGHEEKLFDLTQYFHGSVCEIKTYNIFYACPSRTEQNDPLTNPTQWLFLSAIFDVSCYNTARWKIAVFIFQIASDCPFQFPLCCILLAQTHHNKYTGPALLFLHYS